MEIVLVLLAMCGCMGLAGFCVAKIIDQYKEKRYQRIVVKNTPHNFFHIFEPPNPYYETHYELNALFLRCQENYLNMRLRAQGHVFMNEVHDALGLPRTDFGAIMGWLDGEDAWISFGIDWSKEKNPIQLCLRPHGVIVGKLEGVQWKTSSFSG